MLTNVNTATSRITQPELAINVHSDAIHAQVTKLANTARKDYSVATTAHVLTFALTDTPLWNQSALLARRRIVETAPRQQLNAETVRPSTY